MAEFGSRIKKNVGINFRNAFKLAISTLHSFFYKQQVYKQVTSQVSKPISNGESLRTHSILPISKWHNFGLCPMIYMILKTQI